MSDDYTDDDAFAETQGIWWAGIALASAITFAVTCGLLLTGTYVLNEWGGVAIPYWPPTVAAAILTGVLVSVSVKRGQIKYEPK